MDGQQHTDPRPLAVRSRVEAHLAVVRGDERRDDRQSQPTAAATGHRAGRVTADETVEGARPDVGRHAGAVVDDVEA